MAAPPTVSDRRRTASRATDMPPWPSGVVDVVAKVHVSPPPSSLTGTEHVLELAATQATRKSMAEVVCVWFLIKTIGRLVTDSTCAPAGSGTCRAGLWGTDAVSDAVHVLVAHQEVELLGVIHYKSLSHVEGDCLWRSRQDDVLQSLITLTSAQWSRKISWARLLYTQGNLSRPDSKT